MSSEDIVSTLRTLKTPEARGAVIYDLFKKDENLIISPELEEGARNAVGLAFENQDYRTGFIIAQRAGILEQILENLGKVPFRLDSNEQIPEPVKAIPGYKAPEGFCRREDVFYQMNSWIIGIKRSLVNDVFVPNQQYGEACQQLIDLGDNLNAVALGFQYLDLERAAEVCEKADCGFPTGIAKASEQRRSDLEQRLKQSHVNSVKNGTNKDPRRRYVGGNFTQAVTLAGEYGFESGEVLELVNQGINASLSGFATKILKWKNELDKVRRTMGRDRGDMGERDIHELYERERELGEARYRYVGSLDESVEELVALVKRLPSGNEKRIDAIKGVVYKICNENNSVFDAFGIACAFEDWKLAVEKGSGIISASGSNPRYRQPAHRVMSIIEERVLDHSDEESKKRFVDALRWAAKDNREYESTLRVAKKCNLDEYLMQRFEQSGSLTEAAQLAVSLGKNEKAKELFTKARLYESAIELSERGLERATLYLFSTRDKVEWRIKFPFTHGDRERVNQEIEYMKEAIKLAENRTDSEYISAACQVINNLFAGGSYSQACLFIDELGVVNKGAFVEGTTTVLEAAEKKRDFAGCYHLARLQGKEEDARTYQTLALQFNQIIPQKLDDLIYRRLAPQPHLDDDMAF